MNKKQYNNVIEHTLKHEVPAQTEDSLETARAIFTNMGVALPQGDMKHVYEVIKTDEYMGWKSCTMQEAQEAANNGTAAIGISEDRIVVLAANDEEEPVAETASVMSISEDTSAYAMEGLSYAAYSGYETRFTLYGWAGSYRPVYDPDVHCFKYALLYDTNVEIEPPKRIVFPKLDSEIYSDNIIEVIREQCHTSCRRIESYTSELEIGEYRIAARLPFTNDKNFHFIYQLSDGTWAGKDFQAPSQHFGRGNPSTSPEMWANDAYDPAAGTIYFAVRVRP